MRTNKLCQHSVCSLKSLSPCILIHFCIATGLCLPNTAGWLIASFSISYILCLTTTFSLFFHLYPLLLSSTRPAYTLPTAISTPTTVLLSPGGQAGRLPGWGPRWCSGESASSGSLSRQDGRTALLWPIWLRPVLAPVCDYGPAGGRQGWQGRENTASTQQTEGLTAEGLTNTLICDFGVILLMTTRRCNEYEREVRLS